MNQINKLGSVFPAYRTNADSKVESKTSVGVADITHQSGMMRPAGGAPGLAGEPGNCARR